MQLDIMMLSMKPQLKKILYIPDPRKREKKLSEYLLEFEIEALSMFKTVLVISEYLYRLRERPFSELCSH